MIFSKYYKKNVKFNTKLVMDNLEKYIKVSY